MVSRTRISSGAFAAVFWVLLSCVDGVSRPAAASGTIALDLLGCLPGHVEDVQVEGDYAYCAVRSGLMILDISDVTAPVQISFLPLSGAFSIEIAGHHAYIPAGNPFFDFGGIHIVDITLPQSPRRVGYWDVPERATDVIVADGYAYVADSWNGLRIADLSDPTAPVEVGFVEAGNPLPDLDKVGDTLFLADQYDGLRIIDASDPTSPATIGVFEPEYYVNAVAVDGVHAYVASIPGVLVVDVSVPSEPVPVGELDTSQSVRHITLGGDQAYLSHYDAMSIVDIGKPSVPMLSSFTSIYGRGGPVSVQGDRAHVAAGFGGLRVFAVGEPTLPTELGRYGALGDVTGVTIAGPQVYVTGGHYYSGELPMEPTGSGDEPARAWPYAGLFSIDISDPAFPRDVAYQPFGNAIAVEVVDDLAYVPEYLGNLGIFDVSDPSAPTLIGSTYLTYRLTGMGTDGEIACVVSEEADMRVMDVRDPQSPVEVGAIGLGSEDVEIQGPYAYVTHYYSGLHIVDLQDPSHPTELGVFDMPNWVYGLDVVGELAYVANGMLGLRIIDVSDPVAPAEVGYLDTPGFSVDVAVEGNLAYVADSEGGVRVIDVGTPSAPEEIAFFVTSYPAHDIDVGGLMVIAGLSDGGLRVFQRTALVAVGNEPDPGPLPAHPLLQQGHPNPFRHRTEIAFAVPREGPVELAIFTAAGRRVTTLVDAHLTAGSHHVIWTGRDEEGIRASSGIYYCRLEVREHREANKLILLR